MKLAVVLLLQVFLVCGKPSKQRHSIAESNEVHRVVKRAANLNPGFNLAAFREDQLNLHNHYRQLHRVPRMTLDSRLTQDAQAYAEYLAANNLFRHCEPPSCDRRGAGENLAYIGGHTEAETNATERWYEEVFDYNYCDFPGGKATTRPGREGKMVGHFTQLVWFTSTKLGIGYARSADRTKVYVVARYLEHGNINGQYVNFVRKASYLLDTFQDNCFGINGGLTAWSKPGACTKSCGKGVRFQTRSCTNPKPSFNGLDCQGATKRVHPYWCNSQPCTTQVNERDEQCRSRGHEPKSYDFGGQNECVLHCKDPNRMNFFIKRGTVDDGTHCRDSTGACVAGTCVLLSDEPATTQAPSVPSTSAPTTTTPAPQTTTSTAPPTTTTAPPTTTTVPPTTTTAPPTTTTAPPTTPTTAPPTTSTTTPFTTAPPTTTTAPPTTTTTALPTIFNGGYGQWSLPGPCSKTCGGGISFRTRICITPNPFTGQCTGPSREVYKQWCNPQPCDPQVRQREEQCENRGHEPMAHNFGGVDECYLYCRDQQSGYYFNRGAVETGTRCNKGTGACVDNVCAPMKYAPGTTIEGEYKRYPTGPYWNNIVLAIPTGARNIEITHNTNEVIAVVGYRSRHYYGFSGSSMVQGVKVTYHANQDITIAGPVRPKGDTQLVVYAIGKTQADISFSYTP